MAIRRGKNGTVVDFASYRTARAQRTLPFPDRPGARGPRTLSARQLEHRARMLTFLSRRSS